MFSRMFGDETAMVINEIYRESFCHGRTQFKPKYLTGKEIDVFAYINKEIIVCECKFRQKEIEVAIAADEIDDFYKKVKIIYNNEKVNHPQSHLHFWFVTNSVSMNDDLRIYSKDRGIEVKEAITSCNWRTNPKWKINKLIDV